MKTKKIREEKSICDKMKEKMIDRRKNLEQKKKLGDLSYNMVERDEFESETQLSAKNCSASELEGEVIFSTFLREEEVDAGTIFEAAC